MANVFEQAAAALACTDPDHKLTLTAALSADWLAGRLDAAVCHIAIEAGRPAKPELVPPAELPSRGAHVPEGRAALIHAIAHIEFNAINLALDHIVRFPEFPREYISDWIKVAAEEAYHFGLVRDHLHTLGYAYGDFVAHDGLWKMTVRTAHDPLARMALVPRLLEARGLDATPPIQKKLQGVGDKAAVAILDIILRDEVGHVAIGDRWFRVLCEERGLAPEVTYRRLLTEYAAPWPQPPLNERARLAAGFSEEELRELLGPQNRKHSDAN
jgi:uncharacterized ferritin-like protein (DUF455 family)